MIHPNEVVTTAVTGEEIGRCYKAFEIVNGKATAFYMVESSDDPLVEYKVKWDKFHGFTCTCKAGEYGFAHCKDGICKHVKWSVACAREEREAIAEQYRVIEASKPATKKVVRSYGTPQPKRLTREESNNRGFSLLRQ